MIKYFAYSNQANGNLPVRANAVNLFHDLSIQLSENGFFGNTVFGIHREVTLTQQVFQNQLQQAGEQYLKTGTKTLVIIDGLDHIPREYVTEDTLLQHLPPPSDIPEGVYIILGSQSFNLTSLALSVKQEFEQMDRIVSVQPLLPVAVRSVTNSVLIEQLTSTQHDLLFHASGGHPLYLQYVLRTIENDMYCPDIALHNLCKIMKVRDLITVRKNHKNRKQLAQLIELCRSGIFSERQLLDELRISARRTVRTSLRAWHRIYKKANLDWHGNNGAKRGSSGGVLGKKGPRM